MVFRKTLVCSSPVNLVIAKSAYKAIVKVSKGLNLGSYQDFVTSDQNGKIEELRILTDRAGRRLLQRPQPLNQKTYDMAPGVPSSSHELDIPASSSSPNEAILNILGDPAVIELGSFGGGEGSYMIVSAVLGYLLRYAHYNELAGYSLLYFKEQLALNAFDHSMALVEGSAEADQVHALSDEVIFTDIVRCCEILQNPQYAAQCGISQQTFDALAVLPEHIDFPYH